MAQEEVANGAAAEKSVTFTAVKPQLTVEAHKVSDAVSFYKSAFGALESAHSLYPKRKAEQELPHVLSAELELAGSTILVCDVSTDTASVVETMILHLEADDVVAAVAKCVGAGAVKVGEVETDGGVVKGKVTDPFGITWILYSPQANKVEKEEPNKEV